MRRPGSVILGIDQRQSEHRGSTMSWLHKHREDGTGVDVCPECEEPADTDLTYCRSCGYDIVAKAKIDTTNLKPGV